DRGILYTIKELILHGAFVITSYLKGKRMRYTKPFTFLLIVGSVYSLLLHFFNVYPELEIGGGSHPMKAIPVIFDWYYSHYSISLLLIIPVFAFSSYLVFRKAGYNYFEHLVIYAYINGIKLFILILFLPIFYFTHSRFIYLLGQMFILAYNLWVLTLIFNRNSLLKSFMKSVFSIFLTYLLSFVILGILFLLLS
ncbi:MAG: DUF3667 domain-containing protein, partial [Bacteroidales bacterium]